MRFSTIQSNLFAISGLARAQSCPSSTVDFEDLTNVPPLGLRPTQVIPNGYAGFNWANFYGVTPSILEQFLLPQDKIFAVGLSSPANNPPIISATPGGSFDPRSIFIGSFVTNGLTGAASFASASTITVTATFTDGTTDKVTFNFDPPNTVFGVALNAEALQYFDFPCEWADVVSLAFRPQSENGVNDLLGMAIDNFRFN